MEKEVVGLIVFVFIVGACSMLLPTYHPYYDAVLVNKNKVETVYTATDINGITFGKVEIKYYLIFKTDKYGNEKIQVDENLFNYVEEGSSFKVQYRENKIFNIWVFHREFKHIKFQ